jgi:hypothetical protein
MFSIGWGFFQSMTCLMANAIASGVQQLLEPPSLKTGNPSLREWVGG